MKAVFSSLVIIVFFLQVSSAQSNSKNVAAMDAKLRHIVTNGRLSRPDPAPTEFTEDEVNAYFASGSIDLPAGVESVRLRGEPGVVTGTTRVDFDKLRAGQKSMNPLLTVFSGVHDVVVIAHAYGDAGHGYVHVDSVSIDEVQIPRFALQLFVEKFLQPKYPEVGLDSQFVLPNRIDRASVGLRTLTVFQK
jgi:hypothetical protein